jgi:hypothetical protein
MTVEIEVIVYVILKFINPFLPVWFEHAFGNQSDCIVDVKVNAVEISNIWVPSIVFDNCKGTSIHILTAPLPAPITSC